MTAHQADGQHTGHVVEADEEVKASNRIVQFLVKALKEDEKVEVAIHDRTRLFFSTFVDHPPEAVMPVDAVMPVEAGSAVAAAGASPVAAAGASPVAAAADPLPAKGKEVAKGGGLRYEPASYLAKREYLLLAPVVPAIGNAQIRAGGVVLLRFFQGVKCLETEVSYQGIVSVGGEPNIRLSFPTLFLVYRKRRHFRAKFSPEVRLELLVVKADQPPIPVHPIDFSVGGLAFCYPLDQMELLVGDMLKLTIRIPEELTLPLVAYVRNLGRALSKEGCCKGDGRCGVQFDVPNESVSQQVGEVVVYVQREFLRLHQDQRSSGHASHEDDRHPAGAKSGLGAELSKLMDIKRIFKFQ